MTVDYFVRLVKYYWLAGDRSRYEEQEHEDHPRRLQNKKRKEQSD